MLHFLGLIERKYLHKLHNPTYLTPILPTLSEPCTDEVRWNFLVSSSHLEHGHALRIGNDRNFNEFLLLGILSIF